MAKVMVHQLHFCCISLPHWESYVFVKKKFDISVRVLRMV